MTTTKINVKAFVRLARENRDIFEARLADERYGYDRADYREWFRDEMNAERAAWAESDAYRAAQAAKPATFEEFRAELRTAARRRQQYGATAAQIDLLAKLAVERNWPLSKLACDTLTAGEANIIIENILNGK